jgi:predicted nucleotidyltransferase
MGELQLIQQQREKILSVASEHGMVNVRLFGSVSRGDETPESDIDFLVDLEAGRSLLDLGGPLIKLQGLLGRKVDIVTERGLHWYLRDKIMNKARPL